MSIRDAWCTCTWVSYCQAPIWALVVVKRSLMFHTTFIVDSHLTIKSTIRMSTWYLTVTLRQTVGLKQSSLLKQGMSTTTKLIVVNVHYNTVDCTPGTSVCTQKTHSWTPITARTSAKIRQLYYNR